MVIPHEPELRQLVVQRADKVEHRLVPHRTDKINIKQIIKRLRRYRSALELSKIQPQRREIPEYPRKRPLPVLKRKPYRYLIRAGRNRQPVGYRHNPRGIMRLILNPLLDYPKPVILRAVNPRDSRELPSPGFRDLLRRDSRISRRSLSKPMRRNIPRALPERLRMRRHLTYLIDRNPRKPEQAMLNPQPVRRRDISVIINNQPINISNRPISRILDRQNPEVNIPAFKSLKYPGKIRIKTRHAPPDKASSPTSPNKPPAPPNADIKISRPALPHRLQSVRKKLPRRRRLTLKPILMQLRHIHNPVKRPGNLRPHVLRTPRRHILKHSPLAPLVKHLHVILNLIPSDTLSHPDAPLKQLKKLTIYLVNFLPAF